MAEGANGGWVVVDMRPRPGTYPPAARYVVRYVAVPERELRYGSGTIVSDRFSHHQGARDEADRLNVADGVLSS